MSLKVNDDETKDNDMKKKSNVSIRQIRVSKDLYVDVKNHCLNKNINLKTFYRDMLEWYFKFNSEQKEYLACYKNGKNLSVMIENSHIEMVKKIALEANVSQARVVYTALFRYNMRH